MGTETAHLYRLYDGSELGVDGYPAQWHLTLKNEVRRDAGNRCLRCLHPYPVEPDGEGREWTACDARCVHGGEVRINGERVDEVADKETIASYRQDGYAIAARWRILTVHHLDGNKANCRWWNLVPLCQRCHLEIQGKVKMERRWLHEHSAWFRPYAAGYYAYAYLGEDLTRGEAIQRLPELLELEHRQETIL